MTKSPVSLVELLETRTKLIADIQSRFDENIKRFLLSLHDGTPDFGAIDLSQAANLPAVRWKLINIGKLKNNNPDKHSEQKGALEALFS